MEYCFYDHNDVEKKAVDYIKKDLEDVKSNQKKFETFIESEVISNILKIKKAYNEQNIVIDELKKKSK